MIVISNRIFRLNVMRGEVNVHTYEIIIIYDSIYVHTSMQIMTEKSGHWPAITTAPYAHYTQKNLCWAASNSKIYASF